ncbi:Late embryogenesis abundant protein [Sesbania bispinosa]|nr:Late embryogenesis abundant protein [Sesbania bispinosa]
MARSLSQANRLLAQSLSLHRRGYAAASDASVRVVARSSAMVGSVEDKPVSRYGSEACSSWAPDPVTGYYRPINYTPEIDPVELRQMLLNHNFRSSH